MHLPTLPRSYVSRERLWSGLDAANECAVTIVVGPLGSGKTMGVAGWLRQRSLDARARWVTADPAWTMDRLAPLLDERDPTTGFPKLIVIDDAHALPASTVRGIIERVVARPDSVRLLLTTRWELPDELLRPELIDHVTVLRGDMLRLDDGESAALVAAHARTRSPSVAQSVSELADGWCAAVVLFARAVGNDPSALTAAHRLGLVGDKVADRMADEAFSAMTEQERHVILCVAAEQSVDADLAAHLSNDLHARDVLTHLASTGLLVTLITSRSDGKVTFAVHPLLVAVARRRIADGGVDARRAGATVARAVHLDLALGHSDGALRRLLAMGNIDGALALIATRGKVLFLRGQADAIATVLATRPEAFERDPQLWMPAAYVHWFANRPADAAVWLERIVSFSHLVPAEECAVAHLMRARLGLEPLKPAIPNAGTVAGAVADSVPDTDLVDLYYELSVTQCWNGDLAEAADNMLKVIQVSRGLDLPGFSATGLSHLAMILYLQGRENSAVAIAHEVMGTDPPPSTYVPPFARERCQMVLDLVALAGPPTDPCLLELEPDREIAVHHSDPLMQFLVNVRCSRARLLRGRLAAARQALELPVMIPALPRHITTILQLERAALATLARDRIAMRAARDCMEPVGHSAAAAVVNGWLADLDGDRAGAATAWRQAVELADGPATSTLAMACLAQVLDDLGQRNDALSVLDQAVTITEPSRRAVPFLGWVRHGRPMHSLLCQLAETARTAWIAELVQCTSGRPSLIASHQSEIPDQDPRSTTSAPKPVLTPRERAVLDELARGATYADIAARLVVSENTVKTHISSLYAKLSANRRSDALASARHLDLL